MSSAEDALVDLLGSRGYVTASSGLAKNGMKYTDLRDTKPGDIVNSMKTTAQAIVQKNPARSRSSASTTSIRRCSRGLQEGGPRQERHADHALRRSLDGEDHEDGRAVLGLQLEGLAAHLRHADRARAYWTARRRCALGQHDQHAGCRGLQHQGLPGRAGPHVPVRSGAEAQILSGPRRTSSREHAQGGRDEHGHSDERGEWRGRRGRPAGRAAGGPAGCGRARRRTTARCSWSARSSR